MKMSRYRPSDTMPKFGHVTEVRQQWLVRTDGALAHHLQDREISSHLCDNRYRNQQIREDFPVALSEQRYLEREARQQELSRLRQAEVDAEIAREVAEMNLRERGGRRHESRRPAPPPSPQIASTSGQRPMPQASVAHDRIPSDELANNTLIDDLDVEALGLSHSEVLEMKMRLEQEERDALLARELAGGGEADAVLLADMRCAVEAQDGELARLLQDREYKKLQKAKEKARQRSLAKKQQRLAAQQAEQTEHQSQTEPCLLDAYSNPRDLLRDRKNGYWASRSVESDLNYIEPFEKEHIQSKASAIQSKEFSQEWSLENANRNSMQGRVSPTLNYRSRAYGHSSNSIDTIDNLNQNIGLPPPHRLPPPVPSSVKKPRFPDPISIRPASFYAENSQTEGAEFIPDINCNNDLNTFHASPYINNYNTEESSVTTTGEYNGMNNSVISNGSNLESKPKKRNKKNPDNSKKKKGCKIQ